MTNLVKSEYISIYYTPNSFPPVRDINTQLISVCTQSLFVCVREPICAISLGVHNCDTIKGNESLVENINFYFLAPLSQYFNMLHFDPNPITIRHLVTE